MKKFKTIGEYFKAVPKEAKSSIKKIREIVKEEASEAQEVLSYQMPAFKLNKKILIYYAAWKEHIAIYPFPSTIDKLKELKPYKTSKGTIKFYLDKPLPVGLIRKLIKYRVKENLKK